MSRWKKLQLLLRILSRNLSNRLSGVQTAPEVKEITVEQQRAVLEKIRQRVVDVATTRMQLDLKIQRLRASPDRIVRLPSSTHSAAILEQDLATFERQRLVALRLETLESNLSQITLEEAKLSEMTRTLAARLNLLTLRRDVAAARSIVAGRGTDMRELVRALGKDLDELTNSLEGSEARTRLAQDNAEALDDLLRMDHLLDDQQQSECTSGIRIR